MARHRAPRGLTVSPVRRFVLMAALPLIAAMLALVLGLQRGQRAAPACITVAQPVVKAIVPPEGDSSVRLALSSAFAIVLLGGCLLALSLRDQRASYRKLQKTARRVVEVQEEERTRWSRELHDGTGQMLVAAKLKVESALQSMPDHPEIAARHLVQALARIREVSAEVRRVSHTLRPLALDTLGLAAALRQLTDGFASDTGIHCALTCNADAGGVSSAIPDDVATAFFRVAQEALTNISKHANATHVDITLDLSSPSVGMMIEDDGQGFDVDSVIASAASGIGLRNLRERLAAVGGRMDIRSRPGRTTLTAATPWKR